MGLQHRDPDQRRIPMDVVDTGVESEVILALNDPEGEAAPLERSRYGDDVVVQFFDRHFAVVDRLEFDISRIIDGCLMISPSPLFEPAAIRVMPTQVCVERLIHGRNITSAGHFARGDDLP